MSDEMRKLQWASARRKIGELLPWAENPRSINEAEQQRLARSYEKFGQVQTIAIGPEKEVYDGHQRIKTLMEKYGPDHEVDVRVASRALTDKERRELVVLLHEGATGHWDFKGGDPLKFAERAEMLEWGFPPLQLEPGPAIDHGVEKGAAPNLRKLPIDVIFTFDAISDVATMIAFDAGWKIGTRSAGTNGQPHTSVDRPERWTWRFDLTFIDNHYTAYNHEHHRDFVAKFHPKYATVRDIMTEAQCAEAGIAYYPFDQIMEWAEDMEQHTDNVIVIPKYDCIADIPEKYVLGYSVPTSHGGTPLHVDAFRGRRVHLLGGSWTQQRAYLAALGDDVVSLDNNYIYKVAQFGTYFMPDGTPRTLKDEHFVLNPIAVSFALTVGNIGLEVNRLCGIEVPEVPPAPADLLPEIEGVRWT